MFIIAVVDFIYIKNNEYQKNVKSESLFSYDDQSLDWMSLPATPTFQHTIDDSNEKFTNSYNHNEEYYKLLPEIEYFDEL